MKKTILIFAAIFMLSMAKKSPWKPIFNGKSMEGWEHVGAGNFIIENGMLKTEGGMGLLYFTKQKFENTEIKVVFKGSDKNNAGVFIRIPEKPTEAWMPVMKGYEVQIDAREDQYHSTGVLYSLTKAKAMADKAGEWNEMIISLRPKNTKVTVNGILITDFNEGEPVPEKVKTYEPDRGPRPESGYIGLQNHGGSDVIYFKEVSVRPIK